MANFASRVNGRTTYGPFIWEQTDFSSAFSIEIPLTEELIEAFRRRGYSLVIVRDMEPKS